jgi:hypothetical protein
MTYLKFYLTEHNVTCRSTIILFHLESCSQAKLSPVTPERLGGLELGGHVRVATIALSFALIFPNSVPAAPHPRRAPQQSSATQTGTTPERDPQAIAILNQCLGAVGGASATASIQDFTGSGSITYFWAGQQVSGPATVKGRGTGEFRLDATLSAGTRSWAVSPMDGSIKDTDGTVTPIPAIQSRNLGALSLPQLKVAMALNNSAFSIRYGGLTDVDGHKVYLVQLQQVFSTAYDPNGFLGHLTAMDVLLDATSYQIVLIRDIVNPPNHPTEDVVHEIEFSDYRLTAGFFAPFSITESVNGQRTWALQITAISLNTGLTDADFKL